ncbi:hypothetical protein Bca52824_094280 [Brassica carinata]|uniref:Uncharacterized protein n=1 Tax=Brassica carinata TaxID=52824 RepID=A0A8X7P2N0_BRACI|nr:hypothetical protein Bca52824_094280 [Brassica carinata]
MLNDLTVDPFTTIPSQELNERHHVFDFADSPKRILCGYLLHQLGALSFEEHLVAMGPGATQFAVIPVPLSSFARILTIVSTAAFDAA